MVISPPQFGGWSHYIYGSQYSIPRFNQIGSESTRLCSFQMTQSSTRPRQALGARKDQIFQVSQYRQLQFGFAFQVLCGLNPWLFPMILHLLERTFRWSVRRVYFKYRKINSFWGNIVGIGSRMSHLCFPTVSLGVCPKFQTPGH